MKKSLIILVLALLQCACAAQQGAPETPATMLSFDAISAEITVSYEAIPSAEGLSGTVAANLEK